MPKGHFDHAAPPLIHAWPPYALDDVWKRSLGLVGDIVEEAPQVPKGALETIGEHCGGAAARGRSGLPPALSFR